MTGLLDRGNKLSAVRIDAAGNTTVGGTATGAGNVLSGNGDTTSVFAYGVLLENGANNTTVAGNFIGLGSNGTTALGNQRTGVAIVSSPNNTIGGTSAAARNVIGSNLESGVYIQDVASSGNTVAGNYIGTDVSGTLAKPNALRGIVISSGTNNTIGGTVNGAGNLIAANTGGGVTIERRNVSDVVIGNVIAGNTIGLSSSVSRWPIRAMELRSPRVLVQR